MVSSRAESIPENEIFYFPVSSLLLPCPPSDYIRPLCSIESLWLAPRSYMNPVTEPKFATLVPRSVSDKFTGPLNVHEKYSIFASSFPPCTIRKFTLSRKWTIACHNSPDQTFPHKQLRINPCRTSCCTHFWPWTIVPGRSTRNPETSHTVSLVAKKSSFFLLGRSIPAVSQKARK